MRLSPLLRQISASTTRIPKSAPKSAPKTSSCTSTSTSIPIAEPQQKLPLPEVFDGHSKNRLRPPQSDFLPSLINAPTSLPPIFIKPEPADRMKWWSTAKDVFYKGRSYFVFYKTGLTQVKDNWYSCGEREDVNRRKIRKVLKAELMRQFKNIHIPGSSNIRICRSEFQMCLRTSRDLKKLPLFIFLIVFCEELTPIIGYFIGHRLFPSTVITPAQRDRRRRKRMDLLDRKNLPVTPRVTPTIDQVKQLPRRTIIHECRVFSDLTPILLLPTVYLRERLIRRINYLEYDDELIRQSARPDLRDMDLEEIKAALEERGVSLYTVVPKEFDKTGLTEKSPEDIIQLMRFWLKLNENKHPERPFRHEIYLKEMIRYGRLPDL